MLDQEIYELEENLAIEDKIHNSGAMLPKEIERLSLVDLREHLISSSQEYYALSHQNKTLKDKLKKCAAAVHDLPKLE